MINFTSRINIRSNQRNTSGPSSYSALNVAIRAINTAAASWSNEAGIEGLVASAQLIIRDVFCCLDSEITVRHTLKLTAWLSWWF